MTWCWRSPAHSAASDRLHHRWDRGRTCPSDLVGSDKILSRRLSRLHPDRCFRPDHVARRVPGQQGSGAGNARHFNEDLSKLTRAIRRGDGEALLEHFTRTRAIRRGIVEIGQDSAAPDFGRPHGAVGERNKPPSVVPRAPGCVKMCTRGDCAE